jgi:hypothetical protein
VTAPKQFQQYNEGDSVSLYWNNNGFASSTSCTVKVYKWSLPALSDTLVRTDVVSSASGSVSVLTYPANMISASILPYYVAVSCDGGSNYVVSNFFTVSKANVSPTFNSLLLISCLQSASWNYASNSIVDPNKVLFQKGCATDCSGGSTSTMWYS